MNQRVEELEDAIGNLEAKVAEVVSQAVGAKKHTEKKSRHKEQQYALTLE